MDCDNVHFLNIKLKNNIKSFTLFLKQIRVKESMNLWEHLEDFKMFDEMLKYDVYSKLSSLDIKTI